MTRYASAQRRGESVRFAFVNTVKHGCIVVEARPFVRDEVEHWQVRCSREQRDGRYKSSDWMLGTMSFEGSLMSLASKVKGTIWFVGEQRE